MSAIFVTSELQAYAVGEGCLNNEILLGLIIGDDNDFLVVWLVDLLIITLLVALVHGRFIAVGDLTLLLLSVLKRIVLLLVLWLGTSNKPLMDVYLHLCWKVWVAIEGSLEPFHALVLTSAVLNHEDVHFASLRTVAVDG